MGTDLLGLPLWMVILLPFAKILSTSLSIGSGGSGGIFGPGMVIGGMLGATFWRLGYGTLPDLPQTPAPFVIVGMMALFGGIAHAPLAVMLMVAEMTGNLSMLAPAMIAVGVSTALVGDNTIYRGQLPNRASAPAHRVTSPFRCCLRCLCETRCSHREHPFARQRQFAMRSPCSRSKPPWCCASWTNAAATLAWLAVHSSKAHRMWNGQVRVCSRCCPPQLSR
jgi:hypothetical protein